MPGFWSGYAAVGSSCMASDIRDGVVVLFCGFRAFKTSVRSDEHGGGEGGGGWQREGRRRPENFSGTAKYYRR